MNRKRTRNPDKYKMGKSSLVPYVASEAWNERHARRKDTALEHEYTVQQWCKLHGFFMTIKNNGHHWIFTTHVVKGNKPGRNTSYPTVSCFNLC